MQIWIDNDGCPGVVRDLTMRTAERLQVQVCIVGNAGFYGKLPPFVRVIQVAKGFDAADDYIVEHIASGDLLITADIPLASRVVDKQAIALSPRGDIFDAHSIKEKLALRNLMQELRGGGLVPGGGSGPFNAHDKKRFADAIDRLATKLKRSSQ